MSGFFESIANLVNAWLKYVSRYITQKMYEREVLEVPPLLILVPDHFKTPEMCERPVDAYPGLSKFVPMDIITKEMCERAVGKNRWSLKFVPGQYKT